MLAEMVKKGWVICKVESKANILEGRVKTAKKRFHVEERKGGGLKRGRALSSLRIVVRAELPEKNS